MYPLIAIIDKDKKSREDVSQLLETQHYTSLGGSTLRQALHLIKESKPNLIIADLALPDCNGLKVVRELRAQTQTPIIILSKLADEATKVGAFKLGADDYIMKSGSSAELLARVEAVLRRCESFPARLTNSVMCLGKLEVNLERQEAWRDGIRQHFSQTEWRLLRTLVKYIGQIVDHQTLLASAWGPDYCDETQYLHVYMRKLRRKLEFDPSHPRFLMTEWGVGYRLVNRQQATAA